MNITKKSTACNGKKALQGNGTTYNDLTSEHNEKSIAYNELATAHNMKSTAYNGKNALQEDSTAYNDLKGHCHEEFAVLGQFCAKIITLRL